MINSNNMNHDEAGFQRKPVRMAGYDYSQPGGYFVTIATHQHIRLLGEIHKGVMLLSSAGKIVDDELRRLSGRFQGLVMDEYMVMPDHIHSIFIIEENFSSRGYTLGQVVRAFQARARYRYNLLVEKPLEKLWQRNYYEHVIRDERDLTACREYILNNINTWEEKRSTRSKGCSPDD
jgi:putative transposase